MISLSTYIKKNKVSPGFASSSQEEVCRGKVSQSVVRKTAYPCKISLHLTQITLDLLDLGKQTQPSQKLVVIVRWGPSSTLGSIIRKNDDVSQNSSMDATKDILYLRSEKQSGHLEKLQLEPGIMPMGLLIRPRHTLEHSRETGLEGE